MLITEEKRTRAFPLIDIHAHILPGLDHGPATWEESLGMAGIASADGIVSLAATPHHNYEFRQTPDGIRKVTDELRDRLEAKGIKLDVFVGGDYHLTPELVAGMDEIITLGDNGRYFLLEFPSMVVPPNVINILKMFIDHGLTPVITHPERNPYLYRRTKLLEEMTGLGCPIQITAGSLTGLFGEVVQQVAGEFIKRGLCHILASDAHWVDDRPPILSPYLPVAAGISGEEAARAMMLDNPNKVLNGEDII